MEGFLRNHCMSVASPQTPQTPQTPQKNLVTSDIGQPPNDK